MTLKVYGEPALVEEAEAYIKVKTSRKFKGWELRNIALLIRTNVLDMEKHMLLWEEQPQLMYYIWKTLI